LKATVIKILRNIPSGFAPGPLRRALAPYDRLRAGLFERNHYAYIVAHAADLARRLDLRGITAVEFGVAGGTGLLLMERYAALFAEAAGVHIDVLGFDGGTGMPPPRDYRDCPHIWAPGFYLMDEGALRSALRPTTSLVLGPISETVDAAVDGLRHPIGAIAFDLDYYSSTRKAFRVFARDDRLLPRAFCYFDDIIGTPIEAVCEETGELAAIRDYNSEADDRRLLPDRSLLNDATRKVGRYRNQIYLHHAFRHPLYTAFVGRPAVQLELERGGHAKRRVGSKTIIRSPSER
jgi:hypothetical protein